MSGSYACACGGCFENIYGEHGDFCFACEEAGCPDRPNPHDTNCQVEPEPESEDFPGFASKA